MTAKEKAQELVEKFNKNEKLFHSIDFYQAKQCALIAVDEIIDTIEYSSQADETSKIIYWDKVKEEIEKL